MARHICPICVHQDQDIRDWFDQGKSVEFIVTNSGNTILPSDLEFHSRHSARKVKLAEPTSVPSSEVKTASIAEIRESLEQHAIEAKQGYRACIERGDANGAGKFDVSYRNCLMSIAELDQKAQKSEVEAREIAKEEEASAPDGVPSIPPAAADYVLRKVRAYYQQQIDSGAYIWCPYGCKKPVQEDLVRTSVN